LSGLSLLREWLSKSRIEADRHPGDETVIGPIKYIEAQLHKIDTEYPRIRAELVRRRLCKTMEIYREKLQLRDHYSKYYGSIQEYLDAHPIARRQQFKITLKLWYRALKKPKNDAK